jgi:hypothetical protein
MVKTNARIDAGDDGKPDGFGNERERDDNPGQDVAAWVGKPLALKSVEVKHGRPCAFPTHRNLPDAGPMGLAWRCADRKGGKGYPGDRRRAEPLGKTESGEYGKPNRVDRLLLQVRATLKWTAKLLAAIETHVFRACDIVTKA